MKKITILLLALLIVTSCFTFVGCDTTDTSCVDGNEHYFISEHGRCTYCHKKYCEAYGYHSYTCVDSKTGRDYCEYCGKLEPEGQQATDGDIPIGTVIFLGIILLVVGLILHRWGISAASPFLMRAPMIAFLIFTLGTFLAYGVICGIIMVVFLVLYLVFSVGMNRRYLDYDDVF